MRYLSAMMMVLLLSAPAMADTALPSSMAVSDDELATMTGRFTLPNGLAIALSVRQDTSIDGQLLLRTIFVASGANPTLSVYAPAGGQGGAQSGGAAGASATTAAANPIVQIDRDSGIVTVVPGMSATMPQVALGDSTGVTAAPEGTAALPVGTAAGAVETPAGRVEVEPLAAGTRVTLAGNGVDISHIVGQAYGTIIANTADNRVIDTATTINLELNGATPENVGSTFFRVEGVALDATSRLIPR